jgi:hypothetical protein
VLLSKHSEGGGANVETPSALLLVVLSPVIIFSLVLIGCLFLDGIDYLIHITGKKRRKIWAFQQDKK